MFTTTTAQPARTIAPRLVAGTVAAAATAVVSVVVGVFVVVGLAPMSFVILAALVPLVGAARIDAVEGRLPNRLVLLSAVPVSIVCLLDPFVDRLTAIGGVTAGALLLAGPLLTLHVITPASMGFGDVKAGASLGATLGLVRPELALTVLCLASAITAGWGVARRSRHVAFGPGLVLAAVAVLAVNAWVGNGVTAWR